MWRIVHKYILFLGSTLMMLTVLEHFYAYQSVSEISRLTLKSVVWKGVLQ